MVALGKWCTFLYEAFLAIPIVGGLFIFTHGYTPLMLGFVLHLIVLVLSLQNRASAAGNFAGVLAAVLGWIPFLGWFLHGAAAFLLLVEAMVITGRRGRTRY